MRTSSSVVTICIGLAAQAHAAENLDYVAEHLGEVPMDNRLATLPLWSARKFTGAEWRFAADLGHHSIKSKSLKFEGEMLAFAIERVFDTTWSLRTIVFADDLRASGAFGEATLNPTYLTTRPPLALPASVGFDELTGDESQEGAAIGVTRTFDRGWLRGAVWTFGLAWQRQTLERYRAPFTIIDGANAGVRGAVDYSTSYSFVVPYTGMQWLIERGKWTFAPHWQYFLPLPRRGFVGAIEGPGFALHGDSGSAGYGKYVSDQLLTGGCALIHRPSGVRIDLGTTLVQYFMEPFTHDGVDRNVALTVGVEF